MPNGQTVLLHLKVLLITQHKMPQTSVKQERLKDRNLKRTGKRANVTNRRSPCNLTQVTNHSGDPNTKM